MTAKTLSMWTNDCDYVIAYSAADADWVCAEGTGFSHADEHGELPGEAWERVPDDKPWTRLFPDEPGKESITKTAREWCESEGRGYHSCTEY